MELKFKKLNRCLVLKYGVKVLKNLNPSLFSGILKHRIKNLKMLQKKINRYLVLKHGVKVLNNLNRFLVLKYRVKI